MSGKLNEFFPYDNSDDSDSGDVENATEFGDDGCQSSEKKDSEKHSEDKSNESKTELEICLQKKTSSSCDWNKKAEISDKIQNVETDDEEMKRKKEVGESTNSFQTGGSNTAEQDKETIKQELEQTRTLMGKPKGVEVAEEERASPSSRPREVIISRNISKSFYLLFQTLVERNCLWTNMSCEGEMINNSTYNLRVKFSVNYYDKDKEKNLRLKLFEVTSLWKETTMKLGEEEIEFLKLNPLGSSYLWKFQDKPVKYEQDGTEVRGLLYFEKMKLMAVSTTEDGVKEIRKKLERELGHLRCSLSKEEKDVLSTKEWNEFISTERKYLFVSVKDGSMVIVAGEKVNVDKFGKKFKIFLEENSKIVEKMNFSKETVKFLKSICQEQIFKIAEGCKVTFYVEHLEICGRKSKFPRVVDDVNKFISRVDVHEFDVEQPGLKAELFDLRNEASNLLYRIGGEFKCSISVSDKSKTATKEDENKRSWTSYFNPSNWFSTKDPNQSFCEDDEDDDDDDDNSDQSTGDSINSTGETTTTPSKIQVVNGSITDCQKAQVLVNAMGLRKCELYKCGVISKAFSVAGGNELQQEFQSHKVPHQFGLDLVTTRPYGKIVCNEIYHIYISKHRNGHSYAVSYTLQSRNLRTSSLHSIDRQLLKAAIKLCMNRAIKSGYQSITFPTLGCGKLGYMEKGVCKCFYEAEHEILQNYQGTLKIFIYAYDPHITASFIDFLTNPSKLYTIRPQNKVRSKGPPKKKEFEISRQFKEKIVTFTVRSLGKDKINEIKSTVRSEIGKLCCEVILEHEMVPHLNSLSKESCDKLSALPLTNFSVKIEFDKKRICIRGLTSGILDVKEKIYQILNEEKKQLRNPAFVKSCLGVREFLKLLATSEELKFPNYWKTYKSLELGSNQPPTKSTLNKTGEMFKAIKDLVMKTWDPLKAGGLGKDAKSLTHSNIEVINIYVVESPALFMGYRNKLKTLCHVALSEKQNKYKIEDLTKAGQSDIKTKTASKICKDNLVEEINEHYLFHGTKSEVTDIIMEQGIDSRVCSPGAMFGRGAYFAESSTKADQYTDDKANRTPQGTKLTMFLARVLLGKSYVSTVPYDFQKPPCINSSCSNQLKCLIPGHKTADSVIGTHRSDGTALMFREFIVYKSEQSYPEFLIEYMRK